MAINKYQKYISSLLGTMIYLIGMGSLISLPTLNVYITSYIKLKQQSITMHYGLFLQPIITLTMSIANPIGGYIEKKIGFHYSIILGNIISLIGIFGLYLIQNIWLCYLFLIIIGFSCFSLNIPTKNILFYYPEKKGFIGAVINLALQISVSIYNLIGEVIINKEGYSFKDNETYYPEKIAKNTPTFYIFQMIILPILTLLSLLFIYVYDSSFDNENNVQIENQFTSFLEENNIKNNVLNLEIDTSTPTNNENEEEDKKEKDEKYKNDIKKAIKSKQFRLLCGISFCLGFIVNYVALTFRIFAALIGMKGDIFKVLTIVQALLILTFTPIWGCLIDQIGAKIILTINCCLCLILGILLIFSINFPFLYILSIGITVINVQGLNTAINTHILDIFTIKYSLEIGGLITLFIGLTGIISSILSFVISLFYTEKDELKTSYRIIYICGTLLVVIGLILNNFESGEKFNFDDKDLTTDNGEKNIIKS